eukprot:236662-Rhodomonas_salina.1
MRRAPISVLDIAKHLHRTRLCEYRTSHSGCVGRCTTFARPPLLDLKRRSGSATRYVKTGQCISSTSTDRSIRDHDQYWTWDSTRVGR